MKRRRKKSGNGTKSRQWIYIFVNIPFVLLCKVGISGNVSKRRKEVSESTPGIAVPIFAMKIRNAYGVEQFIHHGFEFLNVPWFGSGKTEWFWIILAPFAIIIVIGAAMFRIMLYLIASLLLSMAFGAVTLDQIKMIAKTMIQLIKQ